MFIHSLLVITCRILIARIIVVCSGGRLTFSLTLPQILHISSKIKIKAYVQSACPPPDHVKGSPVCGGFHMGYFQVKVLQLLTASMELISQMRLRSWSMICFSCWFFCLSFLLTSKISRLSSAVARLIERSSSLDPSSSTKGISSSGGMWSRPAQFSWHLS